MTSLMSALYKGFVCGGPVFFAAWLLVCAPVSAQTQNVGTAQAAPALGDLYSIEGVDVDVTAGNAVKAREQALAEAQVKAFEQLAQRSLTPEQLATYTMPDADTIMALVKDFEVTNERLSATRYKGTFTVRFRPQLARQYLRPAQPVQQVEAGPQNPAETGAYTPSGDPRTQPSYGHPATASVAQQPNPNSAPYQSAQAAYQYQAQQAQQAALGGTPVTVRARFANVQEWVRLKTTLERNRHFPLRRVIALRPKEALVELAFNGTPAELQQALGGAGLSATPAHSVSLDAAAPILDVGFGGFSRY